jgi:hypothetical protein
MFDKHIHIVTHDIPYPVNYGGVIDIFEKIKALKNAGITISLHCFYKGTLQKQPILLQYCKSVFYYKRSGLLSLLDKLPFIVASRASYTLLQNLLKINAPILFEGIHSCYFIHDKLLAGRKKVVRLFNVENIYYSKLAANEKNIFKKLFFYREAGKLLHFEKNITNEAFFLTLSEEDKKYYKSELQKSHVEFLPAFIPNSQINCVAGKGDYVLYHGNLAINENEVAVLWLIDCIQSRFKLVIAGKQPSQKLVNVVSKFKNIQLVANPTDEQLQTLIAQAHIHALPSFNQTGVKLKLLNALFNGRHCLVNSAGVKGSGLEELCVIEDSKESFLAKVEHLMLQEFTTTDIAKRQQVLQSTYNNLENSKRLLQIIFS